MFLEETKSPTFILCVPACDSLQATQLLRDIFSWRLLSPKGFRTKFSQCLGFAVSVSCPIDNAQKAQFLSHVVLGLLVAGCKFSWATCFSSCVAHALTVCDSV